jgi:hypothetical protein
MATMNLKFIYGNHECEVNIWLPWTQSLDKATMNLNVYMGTMNLNIFMATMNLMLKHGNHESRVDIWKPWILGLCMATMNIKFRYGDHDSCFKMHCSN